MTSFKQIFLFSLALMTLLSVNVAFGQKKKDKKKKKKKNKTEETTTATMNNEIDSLSYAVGINIAENLTQQGMELNPELLAKGLTDKMGNTETMSSADAMKVIQEWQQAQQVKKQAEREAALEANKKKGEAFLAENATKEGVVVHESGLQYKVLKEGTGASPTVQNTVTLHYAGRLIDGREFDSSIARGEPATFPLSNLIRAWQIAVPMMKVGGEWEIYVPSELGYGPQGAGQMIGPNETLIFYISLLDIKN